MRNSAILPTLSLFLFAACGIPKEEHQKALDDQQAAFDAKMKEMQKANEGTLAKKENHIGQLETELKRLGGDLDEIRKKAAVLDEKLGEKSIELASAKQEVQATTSKLEETASKLEATQTELDQVRRMRAEAEATAKAFQEVALKLKSMVDAGQLEVVTRKGRMTLKLPDDILFPAGSEKLKKDGKTAIESVAAALRDVKDRDFLISGHTDPDPVKKGGRFASNWDLSTARAVEVVKLMIANGVPAERVAAAGFGEFDPVAPNDSKDNKAKNRRLEIIVMPRIEDIGI